MRWRFDFSGTLSFGLTPATSPSPGEPGEPPAPLEDAKLIFDPTVDRSQVSETADEFRLTYVPPSSNPARPPAVARIAAYSPGSIPADFTTADHLGGLVPIASVDLAVGSFGRFVGTLDGLPAGQYDAVILTGFED